ncbi:MAG: anthrax toxin-like adenylyl cyclase domain-containing protein [Legionella sp.]|nr:anthrax toxin-like adenylyl cyclase domain-containing protein [Legionella sp.]
MKIGIEGIKASHQYGMPVHHMRALSHVAEKANTGIAVRPVSLFSAYFIRIGCPSKPFNLKNKTTRFGVCAGLVPMNPLFNDVPVADEEKYKTKAEQFIEDNEDYEAVELYLSEERIKELEQFFLGTSFSIDESSNNYIICWDKDDIYVEIHAIYNRENNDFKILDSHMNPVWVIGLKGKPLTSDYDLLVVCPSYRAVNFSPTQDKTPFGTSGLSRSASIRNQEEIQTSFSVDYSGPKEIPDFGNGSARVISIVDKLNQRISKIDPLRDEIDLKMFHHNEEFHNPFADKKLENHFPALIALPVSMNLSVLDELCLHHKKTDLEHVSILLLETVDELNLIRDFLRDQGEGYYWPFHVRYRREMSLFRAEAHDATANAVNSLKKSHKFCENASPSRWWGMQFSLFKQVIKPPQHYVVMADKVGGDANILAKLTKQKLLFNFNANTWTILLEKNPLKPRVPRGFYYYLLTKKGELYFWGKSEDMNKKENFRFILAFCKEKMQFAGKIKFCEAGSGIIESWKKEIEPSADNKFSKYSIWKKNQVQPISEAAEQALETNLRQ